MIFTVTRRSGYGLIASLLLAVLLLSCAESSSGLALRQSRLAQMDEDLLEVSVTQLQAFYASGKYSVAEVTQWYLDRIRRYDEVYHAFLHVDQDGALAAAVSEDDARKADGAEFRPGALWGVPIVVKANTSVKGLVTSAGWEGYLIPGHELIAPADATIVAKMREAGAIILGQTNLPDFAASDTTISSAGGRTGNAYDWHFTPGGSSGGTATAVSANFALLGTGTDTSNSIRLPSGASGLVGVLPTRGLVSIHGIHPLDWLLDNAGPMARNVTDAAIALTVMAGEDPGDSRTQGSAARAQPGPYTRYLKADALNGKRFGVPAFILQSSAGRFQDDVSLRAETREMFMKAVEELRAAGATVLIDETILPESFEVLTEDIHTQLYIREGIEEFLRDFGPAEYHSTAEYEKSVGRRLPGFFTDYPLRLLGTDLGAQSNFYLPQRRALAVYIDTLDRLQLDGFVYPALQMPPNDETIRQPDGGVSRGAHTRTGWTNTIGVPAVTVPAGLYATGLPFGLEFSARPWRDGDLLGWAFAYEQATQHRESPLLTSR